MNNLVESRLRETEMEVRRLQRVASLLDSNHCMELMKETMSEPSIKEVPQTRVISKRDKGVIGETIGRLIGELVGVIHMPENQSNYVKIVGPFVNYPTPEGVGLVPEEEQHVRKNSPKR